MSNGPLEEMKKAERFLILEEIKLTYKGGEHDPLSQRLCLAFSFPFSGGRLDEGDCGLMGNWPSSLDLGEITVNGHTLT